MRKYLLIILLLSPVLASCAKNSFNKKPTEIFKVDKDSFLKSKILLLNSFDNSFHNSTITSATAWTGKSGYKSKGKNNCEKNIKNKENLYTEYNNTLFNFNPQSSIDKFFKSRLRNNIHIINSPKDNKDIRNIAQYDYILRINPAVGYGAKFGGQYGSMTFATPRGFGGYFDARNPVGWFFTSIFGSPGNLLKKFYSNEIHWYISGSIYDVKKKKHSYFATMRGYNFVDAGGELHRTINSNRKLSSVDHICEFNSDEVKKIDKFIQGKSKEILENLFMNMFRK